MDKKRQAKAVSQKVKARPSFILLSIAAGLTVWGLITVGTTSFPFSLERTGSSWFYLFNQLIRLAIGVGLGLVVYKLPLKFLKKISPALFFLNLLLALLVFLPSIGLESGGAKRWLTLGGVVFQPSELLKITFIIYLAAWLSGREKVENKKKHLSVLAPFAVIMAVLIGLLIKQPDMSTLGIIFLAGIVMYFTAKTPLLHTIAIGAVGCIGGALLIKKAPYRMARLFTFLNPTQDPLGRGYQLRQSLIAVGSGKIWGIEEGLALGMSRQKFGFLPHPMTDSIFAIIGEELGFIGAVLLIALFLAFLWQALKIAQQSKEAFNKLVVVGIAVWISFQAFFNMAGIIGLAPLGGVPLPFFSYGGSHIITEMIAIGLLLNISKSKN